MKWGFLLNRILILIVLMTSGLFINTGYASCTVNVISNITPMPLQAANITVGADAPLGTQLMWLTYNMNLTQGGKSWNTVTCTDPRPVMVNYSLSKLPMPLASWSPSGAANGKVYQTNVPGIGVWIHQGVQGASAVPISKLATSEYNTAPGSGCATGKCTVMGNYRRWDVVLIKTGPVSPGTVLGSSLPCVQVNYTNDVNTAQNMISNTCMTGSVNIVSNTCKTPDVNVNLGKYQVQEFNGKGSTTPWVDTSIKLTDCPAFHGYNGYGNWYLDAAGTNGPGRPTQNSLELQFSPVTKVLDSIQGIIALNERPGSASGVGIQLAYGTPSSATPVNLGQSKKYVQAIGSQGDVTLPLVSRYIQTESNVTPGSADGMMKFIINYY